VIAFVGPSLSTVSAADTVDDRELCTVLDIKLGSRIGTVLDQEPSTVVIQLDTVEVNINLGSKMGTLPGIELGQELEAELGIVRDIKLGTVEVDIKLGTRIGTLLEVDIKLDFKVGTRLGIKLGTELESKLGSRLGTELGGRFPLTEAVLIPNWEWDLISNSISN
jgi:hypothetical protein